jgi:hypothetical protein
MQYVVVSVTERSYPRALKPKMRGRKLRCVYVLAMGVTAKSHETIDVQERVANTYILINLGEYSRHKPLLFRKVCIILRALCKSNCSLCPWHTKIR